MKTYSIKAVMRRQFAISKYLIVLIKSRKAIKKVIKQIYLN